MCTVLKVRGIKIWYNIYSTLILAILQFRVILCIYINFIVRKGSLCVNASPGFLRLYLKGVFTLGDLKKSIFLNFIF